MMSKRKQSDTTVPPIRGTLEDAVRAMLNTPPPPAGHPSTRKAKPKKPKKRG